MNGKIFVQAVISGANNLSANRDRINELNVFPVPDGDTGTNMSMTAQSAATALAALKDPSVGEAAQSAASAMLRGARGNSGVILSLLFRGMAKAIAGEKELDARLLAHALEGGATEAYKAVMKPTEGTILTVARLAAERAEQVQDLPLQEAFTQTLAAAETALEHTPDQLPVLKKAGVVDAGGKGFVVLLRGMQAVVQGGDPVSLTEERPQPHLANPAAEFETDIRYPYCTEYIVNRVGDLDPLALRAYLESIGDSVVAVADDDIIKVHLHTDHPGNAIEEGLKFGWLSNLKIDNMQLQHDTKAHAAEESKKSAVYAPVDPQVNAGFVAVAAGDGTRNLFSELGADAVVSGGQTMNPSTEDLLDAIQSVGAKTVYVLPNNKNIILAAEQAAALADREVVVLQTRSIPEGMAALLAYDPDQPDCTVAMTQAAQGVQTGLVTFAARDSYFEGEKIGKNEILALENGKIVFTEKSVNKAAYKLLKKMVSSSSQFVTILYGEEVSDTQANTLYDQLTEKWGGQLEVSLVQGGQPVYFYILSVE